MTPLMQLKCKARLFLAAFVLACFGLSPRVQAVLTDPEDYFPGGNTAAGQGALLNLREGAYNTAIGLFSLYNMLDGSYNTSLGAGALLFNTADRNTATGAAVLLSNTIGED